MKKILLVKMSGKDEQAFPQQRGETPEPDASLLLPHANLAEFAELPTLILPALAVKPSADSAEEVEKAEDAGGESQMVLLRKLATSSGVYALSSIAVPLVSLVLAPFLTHALSLADYGLYALINTLIGLITGITQLGLSSAFFRAYGYDYTAEQDRKAVIATVTVLLCLVSLPFTLLVALLGTQLAGLLLGRPQSGLDIALASGVILLQNLTVPGLAWLRAENRPLPYSLLSISNLLVTLLATLILVGPLHGGVAGAIIGNGLGYACIVAFTIPDLLWRKGMTIRLDIARSLLAFGLPLVGNFVAYWALQLLDRYLLSLFGSLADVARYSVAYTLGSVMSVVVISPFTLAWPTMMFAIAKRKDAAQTFRLVFRWLSMLLLLAAFAFSLLAIIILDLLFPAAYQAAEIVIPLVSASLVFYGLYYIFMAGANIRRKTWLAAVFMALAAGTNLLLNLILIPLYGALGAATATLLAFIALAVVACLANQRLYPIPFELKRFVLALLVGVGIYVGCAWLARNLEREIGWCVYLGGLICYGGCLVFLGNLLPRGWRSLLRKKV